MELEEFLINWDKQYQIQAKQIALFNEERALSWTSEQKKKFALYFYHLRGHFHDFMWYLGNHANDKETKDIVLKNFAEELNGSAKSHEQMYFMFAESVGINVADEFVYEENYLPFAKEFNHGHIKWLHEHSPEERLGAFAAYERLDNLDYLNLLELVKSLGVSKPGQIFFKVHSQVEHFTPTVAKLKDIWLASPQLVIEAFSFIGNHQLSMWRSLSDKILLAN